MSRGTARALHLFALWGLVTLVAWPAFVLAGTALGAWSGEARQLDSWTLAPKRQLLVHFLEGWRASLPVAASIGVVAVVDHLLLARHRATRLAGGILLPLAGAAIAFAAYRDPGSALPTLVVAGLLLAVPYRAFEWLRRSITGVR